MTKNLREAIQKITDNDLQTDQLMQLVEAYTKDILYITHFGWVDNDFLKPLADEQFSRAGTVENETYTAVVNRHLSGAACLTMIEEIRERANAYGIPVSYAEMKTKNKLIEKEHRQKKASRQAVAISVEGLPFDN